MFNLKVYLIPHSINVMIIELFWIVYTPMLLHPFVYFYPTGLGKNLPPKLLAFCVSCTTISAVSLLDCSVGMANERLFALRNIESVQNQQSKLESYLFGFASGIVEFFTNILGFKNIQNNHKQSKIPLFIFCFASFACFVLLCLKISVILIEPLSVIFLIPADELLNIVRTHIPGLEDMINPDVFLAFQGSDQNNIPLLCLQACLQVPEWGYSFSLSPSMDTNHTS